MAIWREAVSRVVHARAAQRVFVSSEPRRHAYVAHENPETLGCNRFAYDACYFRHHVYYVHVFDTFIATNAKVRGGVTVEFRGEMVYLAAVWDSRPRASEPNYSHSRVHHTP